MQSLYKLISFAILATMLCAGSYAHAQDLQVTALTSNNNQPKYGEEVTLSITISNSSTTPISATIARVYFSTNSTITTGDRFLVNVPVPSLGANRTHTASVKAKIPSDMGTGTRWIGVIANYDRAIRETNTNNNTRALQLLIQVGSAPDLTPTVLTLSKTSFNIGEVITVNFTVNNIGTAEAPASNLSIRLSTNTTISTQDPELKSIAIPKIAAGRSHQSSTTITINSANGTSYIGLFIDPTATPPGAISESNERNNTRNVRVTITSPDLSTTASAVTVTPGNFAANAKVDIDVVVRNLGNSSALATDLTIYFSTNTTLGSADRKITSITLPVIAAQGSHTAKLSHTVTAANLQGFTGPFYILAVLDDTKKIRESRENNNIGYYRVNVNAMDLTPTSISLSKTSIAPNGQVNVTFKIKNIGNRASTATTASIHYSFDSNFTTGDTRLTTVNIPVMQPGAESTFSQGVTLPGTMTAGTRYIAVYADFNRSNREANEFNNFKGTSFTVATYNLQATAFSVTPNSAKTGANVNIAYTIKNTGTAEVPASIAGVYFSTNSTISTGDTLIRLANGNPVVINIPKIGPGQEHKGTATITLPSTLAPRRGYLGIYADRPNSIRETIETWADNGRGAPFTVVADIDLQPTAATVTPLTVAQGGNITVDMTVKNNGTTTSPSFYSGVYYSANATWEASDTRIGIVRLFSGIAGGATQKQTGFGNLRIPTTATSGTGYIIFRADYLTRVGETNENNNNLAIKITVAGRPDLRPTANTPSITKPTVGATINVGVTVENAGGSATTAAALSLYLSTNNTLSTTADTFLGTATIPSIAGGRKTTLTLPNIKLPATARAGRYFLISYADSQGNAVRESNESNNILATPFEIVATGVADLTVINASATPNTGKPGDTLRLSFAVRNAGSAAAGANTASIVFSTSATPTAQDIALTTQSVAALASAAARGYTPSVNIPANAKAGRAYIHITADSTKAVTEGSENNNVATIPITITTSNDPDNDKDGSPASKDCDDNDKTVFPGAKEVCDGKDNNCNKLTDEGANICPAGQTCSAASKSCVNIPKEPAKEPTRPEPPRPEPTRDAGPIDAPATCSPPCQPGQICANGLCIALPDRDEGPEEASPESASENNPENQGENGNTESTTPDQTPDSTTTPDNNTAQDSVSKDDIVTPDQTTTTDDTTTPDNTDPKKDDTTVTKEGGKNNKEDNSNTDLPAPPQGCGCTSHSQDPTAPVIVLIFFVFLAFRKRK